MKKGIKTENKQFEFIDYSKNYHNLVSFGTNMYHPRHRWYSFVEGYSSEFVRRIIGEQKKIPNTCLDPFGGSGTTALTCQNLGIKCYSIESNPFFYNMARAKLYNYSSNIFENYIRKFESYLSSCKGRVRLPKLETDTFFESPKKEKWIFHRPVSNAIVDILQYIEEIKLENFEYALLFELALANILVPYSNVFRNGKCLSYRKDWKQRIFSRKEIHIKFVEISNDILFDIRSEENLIKTVENYSSYYNSDSRLKLNDLENNHLDLIITSPPYLNSRDYTDVYRLELWVLGYVSKFEEERKIRKNALTSHVQIKLPDTNYPNIDSIDKYLEHLDSLNGKLWNKGIPNMIKGYFNDMDKLLSNSYQKLKKNGKAYINVSNSSYGNKVCKVDEILAEISLNIGYNVEEIRIARTLNSSSQQNKNKELRESIIVLRK